MMRPWMVLFVGTLAGCSMLRSPTVVSPDPGDRLFPSTARPGHTADAVELASWWRQFDDPQLTELVSRALNGNDELALARAHEAAVAADAHMVGAALLPSINLLGQAGRNKNLERLPFPPIATDKEVDLAASWQLDLFGALRGERDNVRWMAAAATERRHAVAVAVAADTVATYVAYQAGLAHIGVLQRTIGFQRAISELTVARVRIGFATRADRDGTDAGLAALSARLAPLEQQQQVYRHHLALLTGNHPEGFAPPRSSAVASFVALADRPEILPGQLLLQRPDLRAAHARVQAAAAAVGTAKAEFFPLFSIGLARGHQWVTPGSQPTLAANVFALGAGAVLPIFNAGRLRAQLRGARAQFAEATFSYNHVLLTALEDVDNACAGLIGAEAAREQWLDAEKSSVRAATDAERLYTAGRIDDLGRLVAQVDALEAEDGRISADAALELSVVSIYRALGGGWGEQNSTAAAQPHRRNDYVNVKR
ncbi:MAG: transporter [Gammaproteobacteria bacterium]|nr:transporter [Gammaproteobacteria bacterium]